MTVRIASLYRYPVKGLSPERLEAARLEAGAWFPGDRLFAIENGPSGFDPGNPRHEPKIRFLMLMRDEALARLSTGYDDASGTLVVAESGREVARGDLSTEAGRMAIEAFFRSFMARSSARAPRGAPRLLSAPADTFRFTDLSRGFVSIVNLASVAAIENMVGVPVDPLRFRANIYVEGLAPWSELELPGTTVAAGHGARLRVTKRIERCAATNVDPDTGFRDLDIPATLLRRLGHADCGVYAEVLDGGTLHPGAALVPGGP